MEQRTYKIEIGGVTRELPLLEVSPGIHIAVLNILGDTELVEASAEALAKKLKLIKFDSLVTAEAKSIPLIHALSVRLNKPYVVLRKSYKSYMGKARRATTNSITTGSEQSIYLDERDIPRIFKREVVVVDDVISTGSTLQGIEKLVVEVGGAVAVRAAICTEGDLTQWKDVVSLGHLPVLKK